MARYQIHYRRESREGLCRLTRHIMARSSRIHVAQEEDVAMGMIDFAPLFRSTVGFDRLPDLLDDVMRRELADNYPPYDIEKTGENSYRITMAVAGFAPEGITVTAQPNLLVIA